MTSPTPHILIVDDAPGAVSLLSRILRGAGYEISPVTGGAQALAALESREPDVVISDIRMPEVDGYQVLEASRRRHPDTPVILLTAFGDIAGAMDAIRRGAYDYLPKPYQVGEVQAATARALVQRKALVAARSTTHPPPDRAPAPRPGAIIGRSLAMLDVYKMVVRIGASDVPVLIFGESGTGKELVARSIHSESRRRDRPFIAINCAGLAEGLLESELFGHEKGAFTGAHAGREGVFEQAQGGTLFLDEIGSIGPKMQSQLLRVLQEGELRRVGGNTTVAVDVRVLSATNVDLPAAIAAGTFREDLYYRLNVVRIDLPALRERPEDIEPLARHFIAAADREGRVSLTDETLAVLLRHDWPGNVRELENTLSRAMALRRAGPILPSDLPPHIQGAPPAAPKGDDLTADRPTLEELTRRYARRVLGEEGGNKSRAAQRLAIDRKTLYRLLAEDDDE